MFTNGNWFEIGERFQSRIIYKKDIIRKFACQMKYNHRIYLMGWAEVAKGYWNNIPKYNILILVGMLVG